MNTPATMFFLAGLLMPSAVIAVQPAFKDPLDSHAVKTERAKTAPLTGLARAGNLLVAVGPLGRILVSDDSGKTWIQADVPTSADLVAVSFSTPRHGWAVGHHGVILHSFDSGKRWSRQIDGRQTAALIRDYYQQRVDAGEIAMMRHVREAQLNFKDGPTLPLLDVWFENEKAGFAVGAFGTILATCDAGATWTPWMDRVDNPESLHLNAIRGIGPDIFIASERGIVFRFDRTRQQFLAMRTGYQGSFFGLVGGKGFVIAFGLRGNAYKSTDGGTTWRRNDTGTDANINAGAVHENGQLVLAAQDGSLLVSKDRGESFARLPFARPTPAAGIAPAGGAGIAVVGAQGVRTHPLN